MVDVESFLKDKEGRLGWDGGDGMIELILGVIEN